MSRAATGYVFRCPVCSKQFENDDRMEPLCTGPHPGLNEHEPTVMRQVGVRLGHGTLDVGLPPAPIVTLPAHLF